MNHSHVTPSWIRSKLGESGVKPKELYNDLNVSRFTWSKWMSGAYGMSETTKAAISLWFERKEKR